MKGKAYLSGAEKGVCGQPDREMYVVMAPGHDLHGSRITAPEARQAGFELVMATYYQTMLGSHEDAFEAIEDEAGL